MYFKQASLKITALEKAIRPPLVETWLELTVLGDRRVAVGLSALGVVERGPIRHRPGPASCSPAQPDPLPGTGLATPRPSSQSCRVASAASAIVSSPDNTASTTRIRLSCAEIRPRRHQSAGCVHAAR
jgi:hypothetical protein